MNSFRKRSALGVNIKITKSFKILKIPKNPIPKNITIRKKKKLKTLINTLSSLPPPPGGGSHDLNREPKRKMVKKFKILTIPITVSIGIQKHLPNFLSNWYIE